jgi:hypothetical protein
MYKDMDSVSLSLGLSIVRRWGGYPIGDWLIDIELRLKITQIQDQQKRLAQQELALDGLLSPEQRRELELARIEQELKE